MDEVIVGEIQGNNVIYVPGRDVLFCKNTVVKFPLIENIIRSNLEQTSIPEKNLTIIKNNNIVTFGCLTTTMSNCLDIRRKVNHLKNNKR